MIFTYCDHCKKVIDEVAYVVLAVDSHHADINRSLTGPTHLHWECLPLWGRTEPEEKS